MLPEREMRASSKDVPDLLLTDAERAVSMAHSAVYFH